MTETCVKTLKRGYGRFTPFLDAASVLGLVPTRIDGYKTVHPHSALAMRSPIEF